MTRFNITLEYAVEIVLWSLRNLSERIISSKITKLQVIDLAKAVGPKCKPNHWCQTRKKFMKK